MSVVLLNVGTARGILNVQWRGEDVGYSAIHRRLRQYRGKASTHACCQCGGPARQWAYDHADPQEKLGDGGRGRVFRYSTSLDHYIPLCLRCHRRFDLANVEKS